MSAATLANMAARQRSRTRRRIVQVLWHWRCHDGLRGLPRGLAAALSAAAAPPPPPAGRLGCLCRASTPINRARDLAHPVLKASGATITGSKDALSLDERMLPPVHIFAGQDLRPFNFSTDLIIKNPYLDCSVIQHSCFVYVQISENLCKTALRLSQAHRRKTNIVLTH